MDAIITLVFAAFVFGGWLIPFFAVLVIARLLGDAFNAGR